MVADDKRTDNEELLQMAIRAAKSGQTEGAQVMFRQLYGLDKHNETTLLWLAKLAPNQKERTQWLQRILEVNPDNEMAQKAIHRMTYRREAVENRTLLLFGAAAAVMIILTVFILIIALTS